jgi:putative nucleotidyltransferase with HDIG domain
MRDRSDYQHEQRVSAVAGAIAHLLGLEDAHAVAIRRAAMLHDIGKLVLPDAVLHKASMLSSPEGEMIKMHTKLGHELLYNEEHPDLKLAASIALHHHEHADGTGYPNRLKAKDIPIEARIVTAADIFDALISTLLANEVTACFANPGTSEMQFVSALDGARAMRPVLCQFEGVATGAADGYGRIAGKPACTLLHLGPGYGNGLANLHNARRAFTPIVNVIGDHATYHRQYDAPLNSDIAAIVAPNSIWVRSADSPDRVADLAAEAVAASFGPPGGPVSLILPADSAWLETEGRNVVAQRPMRPAPAGTAVEAAARAVASGPTAVAARRWEGAGAKAEEAPVAAAVSDAADRSTAAATAADPSPSSPGVPGGGASRSASAGTSASPRARAAARAAATRSTGCSSNAHTQTRETHAGLPGTRTCHTNEKGASVAT